MIFVRCDYCEEYDDTLPNAGGLIADEVFALGFIYTQEGKIMCPECCARGADTLTEEEMTTHICPSCLKPHGGHGKYCILCSNW